jgi:cobalamin biosynthesis protein CobT
MIKWIEKGVPPVEPNEQYEQAKILSRFPAEQQKEIENRRQLLSLLARFIGNSPDIKVIYNEPGDGWHWNFQKNVIGIDPKDLNEKPMDYLRFAISHEAGHKRISRFEEIPVEVWRQPGFFSMMKAIEGPRVNNFLAENYPKFRDQMKLAYEMNLNFEAKAKDKLGYQPRFLQASFEYIKQWLRTTKGEGFEIDPALPEDVRQVVQATLKSAQNSWRLYPSKEEETGIGEEIIKKYAQVSYKINHAKIWPEFKKLVKKDLEDQRLQEMLQQMMQQGVEYKGSESKNQDMQQELQNRLTEDEQQELKEAIKQAQQQATYGKPGKSGRIAAVDSDSLSPELKQKIQDYIDSDKEVREQLNKKAKETLAPFEQKVNEELDGGLKDNPDKKAKKADSDQQTKKKTTQQKPSQGEVVKFTKKVWEALRKDNNEYQRKLQEVAHIIKPLQENLQQILTRRREQGLQSGFRTGRTIDINRIIKERATGIPNFESRAWQRRKLPTEKNYAISLLIDLSASMEGEKINETFKAAIILAEVLNRLSIKTEILGFNTRLYEYLSFGQNISNDVRDSMCGMLQETSHLIYANWNSDGWAVSQASERLAKQEEAEKFLFVLSDGIPRPSPMHLDPEYELKTVIKRVKEETDQKIIGLGVGPGTDHVKHYYPASIANIDVDKMPNKLADVIRSAIEN